jgi:hypothetical protein
MNIKSETLLLQERHLWVETLNYIQQGIVTLKNLLTETSKNNISGELLETLEYFQNEFLSKEAAITLLRRDISSLNSAKKENGKSYILQQKKLRHDMQKMEQEFSYLKLNFNNHLFSNNLV